MDDETANALTSVETDSLVCQCLTPWDYQTKRVFDGGGVFPTLPSKADGSGQNQQSVLVCKGDGNRGGQPLMFHNRPFNVGLTDTICPTLANECNKAPGQTLIQPKAFGICSYDSNSMKSDNPHSGIYEADTTRTLDLNGGNPTCNQGGVCVVERMAFAQNQRDEVRDLNDISGSLASEPGMKQQTFIAEEHTEEDDNCEYVVRRLTERECERLQSYMDDWTVIPPINEEELPFWRTVWDKWCDICGAKKKSDNQILKWMKDPVSSSARYKALGNSIALPYWHWMLGRMAEYLPEDATLGSLFDGIGGFPRCWEMIHGKGKTLWASEIEPFPIAVTRYRFKEEQP